MRNPGITRRTATGSRTAATRRTATTLSKATALLGLGIGLATAAGAVAGPAAAMGVPRPAPLERLAASRLTVTYDASASGSGPEQRKTLECTPLGGGPAVDVGCARMEEIGGPPAAVPSGQLCTMIYGGPQTAHVTGVWHGRPVNEEYRRTNGCEVARWERMVPVLPSVTGEARGTQMDTAQDDRAPARDTAQDTAVRS